MEECRRLDRRGPGSGFVLSMAEGEGAAVRFPPGCVGWRHKFGVGIGRWLESGRSDFRTLKIWTGVRMLGVERKWLQEAASLRFF